MGEGAAGLSPKVFKDVVGVLWDEPGASGREIARRVGVPESTLRPHLQGVRDAITRGEAVNKMMLGIDQLRLDGGTQSRVMVCEATVAEYAEMYANGVDLPPVTVFHDGENYWLVDGFQRVAALKSLGRTGVMAECRKGTHRDAILFSVGANAAHGLKRTNADKRRAVETLLRDEEWGQWSDSEIARRCGVTHPFVGSIRKELDLTCNGYKSTARKGADGRTIDTSNIGKPRASGNGSTPAPTNGHATPAPTAPTREREPGEDDDLGSDEDLDDTQAGRPDADGAAEVIEHEGDPELSDDELYLRQLPLTRILTGKALETFKRDALYHRSILDLVDRIKARGGRDGDQIGVTQGAYQFLTDQYIRTPFPPAWLKCGRDGCKEGHTPNGPCPACHGRGYVVR